MVALFALARLNGDRQAHHPIGAITLWCSGSGRAGDVPTVLEGDPRHCPVGPAFCSHHCRPTGIHRTGES